MSEYVYDQKDRLVEVRRHGGTRERYRYDVADNLVEKTDRRGRPLLSLVPGPGNLPTVRRLASGESHYFQYDRRGRITLAATDTLKATFTYEGNDDPRPASDLRDGLGVVHRFAVGEIIATSYLGHFEVTYRRTGGA